MYVGRKFFSGIKNGERKVSNWRSYYGSCKPLMEDIKALGRDVFTREILTIYETEREVCYEETAELFARDVLRARLPDGSRAYYNGNIAGKFFQENFGRGVPKKPESVAKQAATLRGRKLSAEQCAQISARMKNKRLPDSWKEAISKGKTGVAFSDEHKANLKKAWETRERDRPSDVRERIAATLKARFAKERAEHGKVIRKARKKPDEKPDA